MSLSYVQLLAGKILAHVPSFSPDPGGLPGSQSLLRLVNGLAFWALLGCGAGVAVGAGVWGICGSGNNPYGVMTGKRAVIVSLLAAMVIGAANARIGFFYRAGAGVG